MIQVKLPDGTLKEYENGSTALDVASSIGDRLAQATIAAEINGTVVDAMRPSPQRNRSTYHFMTDENGSTFLFTTKTTGA